MNTPSFALATNLPPALAPTTAQVQAALAEVHDPEIPVISIMDLGLVHEVRIDTAIHVTLLPTFVGCPALGLIKEAVATRLASFGRPVEVEVSYAVPWTSERISTAGREQLRASGFAPPGSPALLELGSTAEVACPHCGSPRTVLENLFGPTACRAIYYCLACRQPFEQFKAV